MLLIPDLFDVRRIANMLKTSHRFHGIRAVGCRFMYIPSWVPVQLVQGDLDVETDI